MPPLFACFATSAYHVCRLWYLLTQLCWLRQFNSKKLCFTSIELMYMFFFHLSLLPRISASTLIAIFWLQHAICDAMKIALFNFQCNSHCNFLVPRSERAICDAMKIVLVRSVWMPSLHLPELACSWALVDKESTIHAWTCWSVLGAAVAHIFMMTGHYVMLSFLKASSLKNWGISQLRICRP